VRSLHESLAARWDHLTGHFGWAPSSARAVRDDLLARYGEPHRHYHTLEHVDAVLDALDRLSAPEPATPATRLAVWFHDAIYQGVPGDDEDASARLAEEQLTMLGTPPEVVGAVSAMVRATASHVEAALDVDIDTDTGTALVLDADLSILGAEPDDYDRYTRAVRAEYAHVPDDRFAAGRRAVVESLLARDRLFLTDAGAALFEAAARLNLARELDELRPDAPR
jgi:predicted metal-dependent HD superfamily phosphohydrolase